jgi:hypothetical protein
MQKCGETVYIVVLLSKGLRDLMLKKKKPYYGFLGFIFYVKRKREK